MTRSVPDFAIVGGNPAKFIKWRFPKEVRDELCELKWWEWDDEEIKNKRNILEQVVNFDINDYKDGYMKVKPILKLKE